MNGARCTDIVDGHVCTCLPGFTDASCATDINECAPIPCQNNATCTDLVNGYNCTCVLGFTGKNCAQITYVCGTRVCSRFAKCFLTEGNYSCHCKSGYVGDGYTCQPFCRKTQIFVQALNQSVTFNKTNVGETANSQEICSNGRPMASVDCVYGAPAGFAAIKSPSCERTILSTISQIEDTITAKEISSTIAFFKLATKIVTVQDHVFEVIDGLEIILQVVSRQQRQITTNVMYDAMLVAEQLTNALTSSSNINTIDTTKNKRQKQHLLEVLQNFANYVEIPQDITNFTLTTEQITLQIFKPTTARSGRQLQNKKYSDIRFAPAPKSQHAAEQPVQLVVPGEVIDQAATQLRKETQIAFFQFNNDDLFSSLDRVEVVVSAQIKGYDPATLGKSISLEFSHETKIQREVPVGNGVLKNVVTRTQCSVWDDHQQVWVPNGCELVKNSFPPQCKCYKLANFAMLVDTKILPSAFLMGITTYVGLCLSIIGLSMTIFVFLSVPKLRNRQPTIFLLNICICLMAVCIIFLISGNQIGNRIPCYMLTALLHYFLLATWFWMTANAYTMYKALVKVFQISSKLSGRNAAIIYLVPLAIVLLNMGVTVFNTDIKTYRPDNILFESVYKSRHMCWLRLYSLYFGFLLPVGVMFLINMYFFVAVLAKITCCKKKIQSTAKVRGLGRNFQIAISMICLMGLTWIFGFLMLVAEDERHQTVMAWLFTVFNSTQGLSIFIFNCVLNKGVRDAGRDWVSTKTRKTQVSTTGTTTNTRTTNHYTSSKI
uniref:Fibrillin-2-like n=1 Tax=Phallusia mammillata TaxID=59560 RepID=A0A6F9DD81_9ASCI|nr:fibrillin-2-like [Phallusia mammillata]